MRRTWPLLLILFATPALTHVPARLHADAVYVLPRPEVSSALFGEFLTGAEHFVVKVTHATRFGAPIEILVPHQADLFTHRPAWAVVGPGLPAPNAEELAALPAPLPAGFGAVVDLNQVDPRPVIFESVMRRFYWTSGPLAVVLPKGESELWIWSPGHTRGKFGLGYGVEEGGGYMAALQEWSFYAY